MKRRGMLGTIGAAMLAGCSDVGETTSNGRNGNDAIDERIDIGINQPEWIDNGRSLSVILTNDNNDYTASVEVIVQWFDEQGRYIGRDTSSILALESNSNWYAKINSTAPFEADQYNISARGYRIDDRTVSGIDTRSVDVDSDALTVTAELENELDMERTLHVILSTYNSSWITHSGSIRGRDIPADTIWRFQTSLNQVAYDESTVGDDMQLTVLDQSPIPDSADDQD